jgi:hypothetical protein
MKQTFVVSQHIVASSNEMKILVIDGDVTEFVPRGRRHQLFWRIKTSPCLTYKGPWGTELLFWDHINPAVVKCTESRSQEIRTHISDLLFGD